MGVIEILAEVDREIALLKQARAILSGASSAAPSKKAARPRKAVAASRVAAANPGLKKKRRLSPEGRKRIAEAVKRRWEAQRKAAAAPK